MRKVKLSALILVFLSSTWNTTYSQQQVMKRKPSNQPDAAATTQVQRPTASNVAEALERLRSSVVQIRHHPDRTAAGITQNMADFDPKVIGSGFLVNEEGYVITAAHVVRAVPPAKYDELRVAVAGTNIDTPQLKVIGGFTGTRVDVIDIDDRHDVALLKMRLNPFTGGMGNFSSDIPLRVSAALLYHERPAEGSQVAVSGYPFASSVMMTNVGYLATAWGTDTRLVQMPGMPPGVTRADFSLFYLADLRVNAGNSGGPVYTIDNASVIGICHGFINAPVTNQLGQPVDVSGHKLVYNSGLAYVIPIRYAIDLMQKRNIKARLYSSAKKDKK